MDQSASPDEESFPDSPTQEAPPEQQDPPHAGLSEDVQAEASHLGPVDLTLTSVEPVKGSDFSDTQSHRPSVLFADEETDEETGQDTEHVESPETQSEESHESPASQTEDADALETELPELEQHDSVPAEPSEPEEPTAERTEQTVDLDLLDADADAASDLDESADATAVSELGSGLPSGSLGGDDLDDIDTEAESAEAAVAVMTDAEDITADENEINLDSESEEDHSDTTVEEKETYEEPDETVSESTDQQDQEHDEDEEQAVTVTPLEEPDGDVWDDLDEALTENAEVPEETYEEKKDRKAISPIRYWKTVVTILIFMGLFTGGAWWIHSISMRIDLEKLKSKDAKVRLATVEKIFEKKHEEGYKTIVRTRLDPDEKVALKTIHFLSRWEGKDPVEYLQGAVLDERPQVRVAAMAAMCQYRFRGKVTPEYLKSVIVDQQQSPYVRARACLAAQSMQYMQLVPTLFETMRDENPIVRGQAGAAASRLMGLDFGFRAEAPVEERKYAIKVAELYWADHVDMFRKINKKVVNQLDQKNR